MVALSFITAADGQEASVERFTFDTIDELQEHLDFGKIYTQISLLTVNHFSLSDLVRLQC